MAEELRGRSALVTGGAGGLGAATVRHLVRLGMRVVIFDRNLDGATALALDTGEGTIAVGGDVTDDDDVEAAIDAARTMGPMALLVNIAGGGVRSQRTVSKDGTPHDKDAFNYTMAINAVGTFNVSRWAAAAMGANEQDADGRARCHCQHVVACGAGGPGRPSGLRRSQGGHRRDDAAHGPRPGVTWHSCLRHRSGHYGYAGVRERTVRH